MSRPDRDAARKGGYVRQNGPRKGRVKYAVQALKQRLFNR